MSEMRLPNNDKLIQHYQAIADIELAKGSKADTSKLLAALEAVNVFFHGNISAVHRVSQRERTHKANECHEGLVESHKNRTAKILQAGSGVLGFGGALIIGAVVMGGAVANVPYAEIKTYIDLGSSLLSLSTQGLGSLAGAASSGDQATQALHDHAVKNHQNERNDDQSANQATDGQKNEALRRKKEVQQQEASAWSAAVSSLR